MRSIRLFLTLTIIAIITLVNFVAALRGYRESMLEADALFDEQLLEYALLVSATFDRDTAPPDKSPARVINPVMDNVDDFRSTLVFQVLDDGGNLLVDFNTDHTSPIANLDPGFNDVNFDGYRWHTLTYRDQPRGLWIITAQRYDARFTLAERVILESVLPIILSIPVAGLLVWLLIGAGLKPITRLAGEIKSKEAGDLSPVRLEITPRELVSLRDSTNELLERLQASFEREKRFAADAAHELRTPISVLKVQIHNLLEELEVPTESIPRLQAGIDRMGHLVEQILDLYKTSPDLYVTQFEEVDLFALSRRVVSDNFDQFLLKDQEVELNGQLTTIHGDRFALEVLLKNLLDNASKYTQKGGAIEINIHKTGGQTILEVIDNGPGIPASERGRALERFYRTGGDRHESSEPGCGLGLAIVQHIVELHAAKMELGSPEDGGGLKVTICFDGYTENAR